jgi:hypothetical protein
MAKNTKVLTVLSTAAVTGLITAALGSTAFAKTSAILVQNGANDYRYDYSSLASAFEDYSANPSNGALYQDYLKELGGKSPVALYDDVQKTYIDYTKVASAFEDAQAATKPFNLNAFTEASKDTYTPAAPISDVTVGTDGKIVVTPVPVPVTNLAISSVSAINSQQVVVTFNEAVDKTTAETLANYTATSSTNTLTAPGVRYAQLSDDAKSVTLTLVAPINNQTGKVTVKVSKALKDASGKSTLGSDYTATDLTYSDTTLPSIDSVKAVGNTQLLVQFSEPVNATQAQSILNYRLDGSLFTASSATLDTTKSGRVLTLTFPSALSAGNHSLKLVANTVQDINNLYNSEVSKDFTIDNVADAPVATVVSANQQTVKFKFNRAVTAPPTVTYNGNTVATVTNPSGDNTNFQFTGAFPPAGGQFVISAGVQDFYGNKTTSAQTLAFIPTVDTTKPTVTSLTSDDEGKMTVQFNKELSLASLSNSDFTVKDKDGNTVTVSATFSSPNGVNDYTKVILAPIVSGSKFDVTENPYKVSIASLYDASGNVMDTVKDLTVTVPDKTPPAVTGIYSNVVANKISVNFGEKIDVNTAANLANYKLKINSFNTFYSLPTNARVELNADGKGVTITLPSSWTLPNDSTNTAYNISNVTSLYVSGISDLSGNVMTDAAVQAPGVENLATVDKVEATGTKTVKITLNGTGVVPTTLYGGDFTLSDSIAVQSATINGRVITLTLMNDLPYNVGGVSVNMVAAPSVQGTTTALGSKFQLVPTAAGDLNVVDKIAPVVKSASVKLNAGSPILVVMSSDGLTGTADLTGIGSAQVTDLDFAATETGRLSIIAPYDSRTVGQSVLVGTTAAPINTAGILHDATLSQLQTLATQDGDGDDSTLTITGLLEDGTTTPSFTAAGNHSTVTLKLKVK